LACYSLVTLLQQKEDFLDQQKEQLQAIADDFKGFDLIGYD
jgi:hypothetical protein